MGLENVFEGYPIEKLTDGGEHSDSSEASAGFLPKWIQYRSDGNYIIKASSWDPKRDTRSLYESESEVMASVIAKILGLEHVCYELLCIDDSRSYCRSRWFLDKGQESRSLFRVMMTDAELAPLLDKKPFVAILERVSSRLNLPTFSAYIKQMLIFDYLINNPDRHFRNIEFIYDSDRYSCCPLFDHGNALFGEYSDSVLGSISIGRVSEDYCQSKGFFDNHQKAIRRLGLVGLDVELISRICTKRKEILDVIRTASISGVRKLVLTSLLEQRITELEDLL